jgi:hypothetical protein
VFLRQIGCAVQADYALVLLLTRHTFRDPARENVYEDSSVFGRHRLPPEWMRETYRDQGVHRTHLGRLIFLVAGYGVDAQAARRALAVEVPVFPFGPLEIFRSQFYVVVAGLSNQFEPLRSRQLRRNRPQHGREPEG